MTRPGRRGGANRRRSQRTPSLNEPGPRSGQPAAGPHGFAEGQLPCEAMGQPRRNGVPKTELRKPPPWRHLRPREKSVGGGGGSHRRSRPAEQRHCGYVATKRRMTPPPRAARQKKGKRRMPRFPSPAVH